MELAFITIRFDSPAEQQFVEDHISWRVNEHETWDEDSGYRSWTEFEIDGCKPSDIQKELDAVLEEFNKQE